MSTDIPDLLLVTVCDSCLQASCWQGEFYCDNYKTAGTVELPVKRLREMHLESPDYWKGARAADCLPVKEEVPPKGFLEVGSNGQGEVVTNHGELKPDENGVGHIIFSVAEARTLAAILTKQADIAQEELRIVPQCTHAGVDGEDCDEDDL